MPKKETRFQQKAGFVHPAEGRGLEFDDGADFVAASFSPRI